MAGEVISPLSTYYKQSPNIYGFRVHKIDTVTIHCMAGNGSIEGCGEWFARQSTAACSNYGVSSDGKIGCFCEERKAGWTSSSSSNDMRSITIEVANDGGAPDWHVSDKALNSLINLLVDICRRNPGIKRLRWKNDNSLIGQTDKQNMTLHCWFAQKACPGPYLISKHPFIVERVNKKLDALEMEDYIKDMTPAYAHFERSDTCAVPACGVVA